MPERKFRITGQVISQQTRQGIHGLKVEAWDKDLIFDDMVGSAVTDEQGAFEITFNESYFRELFLDRRPDLFFKVIRDGTLVKSTRDSVLWNLEGEQEAVLIEVETVVEDNPIPPKQFVVRGTLLNPDGTPFPSATVKAFDKELRREKELGAAITGVDGAYLISYQPTQHIHPEKGHADLIVRAYDQDNNEIAISPLICPAKEDEQVTLVVGNATLIGKSEFELLKESLSPLLKGAGTDGADLSPAELTEDDIDYIKTCYPELDTDHLAYFIQAEQITIEARGLAPEAAVPAHAFYGLLRRDVGSNLDELLDRKLSDLIEALDAAMVESVIPADPSAQTMAESFETLQIERSLKSSEPGSWASLGDVLKTSRLSTDQQRYALYLWNRRQSDGAFWQDLRRDPGFQDNGVEEFQFILQLNLLTQSHLPLMRRLQQMRQNGEVKAIKDLVRLDTKDWVRLLGESVDGQVIGVPAHIPGQDEAEKTEIYARAIAGLVEEAFPTAVLASRLTTADVPHKADFAAFFAQNPDFDFVHDYIAGKVATGTLQLEGAQDPDRMIGLLKAMQRVYRLSPHYDDMRALMDLGHDSAWKIVQVGKTRFKQAVTDTLGDAKAEQIYAAAQTQASLTLALLAKHHPSFDNIKMRVLPGGIDNGNI
jgi:hypothetical protein